MSLTTKIIFKNGKEYLTVSKISWNNYLNIMSPNRDISNKLIKKDCSLKEKYPIWCDNCNTGIGSWSNSCTNIINSINLLKYSELFKKDENNSKNIHIEIDRNDKNNNTI
jgi:hypothetical protein